MSSAEHDRPEIPEVENLKSQAHTKKIVTASLKNQQNQQNKLRQSSLAKKQLKVLSNKPRKSVDSDVSGLQLVKLQNVRTVPDYKSQFPQLQSQQQQENYASWKDRIAQSSIRKSIVWMTNSKVYTIVYFIVMLMFATALILYDNQPNPYRPHPYSETNVTISKYLELFCLIYFLACFFLNLFNFQQFKLLWSLLDITTIIVGLIALFLPEESFDLQDGRTFFAKNALKAFRSLKILYFIKIFPPINQAASNLLNSLQNVGSVLVPAAVFIYLYAIIGLFSFSEYQYNRCRLPSVLNTTSNWSVYEGQIYFCGQRQCPQSYECLNPIDFGVDPNQSQLSKIQLGNSLMRYSNIFFALLSTYKQTFGTGSSRLILLQKQAVNYIFVMIYYLSFIYLISYIYLNIFYGLMMQNQIQKVQDSTIKNILSEQAQEEQIRQSKKKKTVKKDILARQYRQSINKNVSQASNKQIQRSSKSIQSKNNKVFPLDNEKQELRIYKESIKLKQTFTKDLYKIDPKPEAKIQNNIFNDDSQENYSVAEHNLQNIETNQKQPISSQNHKQQCCNSNPNESLGALNSGEVQQKNQQQNQRQSIWKKMPSWFSVYSTFNHLAIFLACVNLCLDFRGQSNEFQFVIDCIDVFFYICLFLNCIIEGSMYIANWVFYIRRRKKNHIKQTKRDGFIDNFHFDGDKSPMMLMKMENSSILSGNNEQKLYNDEEAQKSQSNQPNIKISSGIQNQYQQQYLNPPYIAFSLQLQLFVLILCSIGMIYQGIICTSLTTFLQSQTTLAKVLRSAKYLRILSILVSKKYYLQGRYIVISIFKTIYKVKFYIIFWVIIVSTSSLTGFHLFAYRTLINTSDDLDLKNGLSYPISFNGMQYSFIFTILTFFNEQWDYFMFQQYLGAGALVVIWQLFFISAGLLIVSKYFMALLMNQLGDQLDRISQENMDQVTKERQRKNSIKITQQVLNNKTEEDLQKQQQQFFKKIQEQDRICIQKRQSFGNKNITENKIQENQKKQVKQEKIYEEDSYLIMFIGKIIKFADFIVNNSVFPYVRIIFLLLSLLDLAVRTPQTDPNSYLYKVFAIIQHVTRVFFLVEIILKVLCYGFFHDENSYLRRSYVNWINIVITTLEFLSYTQLSDYSIMKSLMKLKVFRCIQFISMKYDADRNMRLTVVGFKRLAPKVVILLLVTCIFYGFFALLFLKIYKNYFSYCSGVNLATSTMTLTDSSGASTSVIIDSKADCLMWGGNWVDYRVNPHNFGQSLLYFMLLASTQGWTSLMIPAASLRGQDLQPIYNSNPYLQFFFLAFFFFGNMIMLNVFIGLTMNNFKKIKDEVTGQANLTKFQKQWLTIKRLIYRLYPEVLDKAPENPIRSIAYKISNSFAYTIYKGLTFICFVVVMSLFTSNMNQSYYNGLIITKFFFVILMSIGFFLQILAFGFRSDLRATFLLKTVIILLALVYGVLLITIPELNKEIKKIMGSILIAMMLIDYFGVLMQFKIVRKILNSLLSVFPATINLLIIMCSVLFIYTVIGMQLFAYLKTNNQLNAFDQNYKSFSTALFSLVKFSLWQNPIDQLSDAAQSLGPDFVCFQIDTYQQFLKYGQMGCGSKWKSYIFFLSFHITYSMILMSSLIALVFDAYSEVRRQQNPCVDKFMIQAVKQEWKNYDPQATGYINYRDFWLFAAKLMKIYNINKEELMSSETKQSFLVKLNIPIYENSEGTLCFQFHQIIEALTKIVFKNKYGESLQTIKADKMFKAAYVSIGIRLKRSYYDSSHVLTLIILKSGLKVWRKKCIEDGNNENKLKFKEKIHQKKVIEEIQTKKQTRKTHIVNKARRNGKQQLELIEKRQNQCGQFEQGEIILDRSPRKQNS